MTYAAATGRRLIAVVLLATAGLSLTACHDGGGGGGRLGAPTRAAPAPRPPAPRPPSPGAHLACAPEMLGFHARGLRHPARRMLLTVTNASDRTCDFAAQRYPLLRLDAEQRTTVPVIGPSDPVTVITLAPGRTAYATLVTSGPGAQGRGEKISQFGVALAPHTAPCQVGLDSGPPVRVDPHSATVTYWQSRREAALNW
ncbi:DUF4232 domain-containing protein [Streptomyces sp. NPDC048650]|uniref:DUF4232 domain-containing protein n=1 Tax=Streptomyces sp. NPDC048650 TaxID=3365583 RepID=UPI00371CD319